MDVPKSSHLVADRDELCCQFVWKTTINLSAVLKDHQVESSDWTIPILHDDADVMVINKPFGLVVHGGDSVDGETLVDLLSSAGVTLANAGGFRSGIVHRLDQFTEGLMVIAKSQMAYDGLQIQFKERRVQKRYYAILKGVLGSSEGVIDRPIGRDASVRARQSCNHFVEGTQKEAITHYRVLNQLSNIALVDVHLITGRTHQIRVHFSSLNCPVLGDALYSRQSKKAHGYYLQSYRLMFNHPVTNVGLDFTLGLSDRLKTINIHKRPIKLY